MSKFKNFLPHIIAVAVFAVLCFAYFPSVLEGKKLEMHDMVQARGMSSEVDQFRDKTGIDPLWTNSMFSGMPAYQISTVSNSDFMKFFFSFLRTVFPEPTYLLFLSLLSFYVLLITFKIDYRLAIAGAIAFSFSSYFFVIIEAGHITKAMAIASAPFVVAGVLRVLKGEYLKGGVLTLFGMWMEIYCNHYQITYYLMLIVGIMILAAGISALIDKKVLPYAKSVGIIAIAIVLSLIPSASSLWSTYDYGKETTRGPSELRAKADSKGLDRDYAFDWSYGKLETMTLLIPDFMGGASQGELDKNSATYAALKENGAAAQANGFIKQVPLYWGDQKLTQGPTYAGAVSVFFFILALFAMKGREKWWLLSATILVLFISWGKNFDAFNNFMFDHFPGFNKFRSVSMALAFTSLTIPLLGFLGLREIFRAEPNDYKKLQKMLIRAATVVGGLCLLIALAPTAFGSFTGAVDEQLKQYPDWLREAIRADRISITRNDALRSLFMILIAGGLIWFYLKNKIKKEYVYISFALLLLVDLWPVDKRYLHSDKFVSASKAKAGLSPSSADEAIMQDKTLGYRVMNMSVSTFNDATTSYFHKSVGGYHGAKLKRYQELIENQISKNNMSVLNMLNTKYFIVPDQQSGQPQQQLNPNACGPAWFVREYKIVPDADSELNSLTNFEPKQTAFIDKRFESAVKDLQIIEDSTDNISMISYAPNDLKYQAQSANKRLAVFSEIYYNKGWNAYVDGKLAEHFRANYVLRAMVIPSGKHTIEFKFEPQSYYTAEKISLAGSVLLSVIIGGFLITTLTRKNTNDKSV